MQTIVTVEQAIFVGKALVGLDMARKEYAAKGEDYGRKKEETALKVTQAYLAVQTARRSTSRWPGPGSTMRRSI